MEIEGRGINIDVFFYRRRIENALPRLIDWVKDLRAGRDPHERPGHFFLD
jgi:hypothetical protein